ncbi:cold-regulated protein 27 isoform X2 [Magnolia sinica]|uniref:cold-regulated protein 27 isoform X2 n=1 Tax=Magnolia sinica TaxID=86752 RepID=UPI00265A0100|nr:cold-regulated protein 27 isoform X2 [Magnolia sinica]
MEGNLRPLDKEMDGCDGSDEVDRLHGSSETSGITLDDGNSTDCLWTEKNARSKGDSVSTEWTDEKHSLYLDSIEALFVKQLHNREYQSVDLYGRLPRTQKLLNQNNLQSNTNSHVSFGQFKVLRSGCWEKLNFGRSRTQSNSGNESHSLLGNPWIQHFRPASTGKRLEETSALQKNENLVGESICLGGQKYGMTTCVLATSSKRSSGIYHQDSVGSNTEMSDQNFVDEGCGEGEQLSSSCMKKRARTAVADVSGKDQGKDQVVPTGKSPVTACTSEKYASRHKRDEDCQDGQSENKTGSSCVKSRPPFFEDPAMQNADPS